MQERQSQRLKWREEEEERDGGRKGERSLQHSMFKLCQPAQISLCFASVGISSLCNKFCSFTFNVVIFFSLNLYDPLDAVVQHSRGRKMLELNPPVPRPHFIVYIF